MERIITMDRQDYSPDMPHFRRPSVRAVIIKDGMAAMVYSRKFDYYKFPGGGIEKGESHVEALIREVREETGLDVIPVSITGYGSVLRVQKSEKNENEVFEQENFYYLCNTTEKCGKQQLYEYENDEGFTLEFVSPDHAIEVNRSHEHYGYDSQLIEREAKVLEHLTENGYFI